MRISKIVRIAVAGTFFLVLLAIGTGLLLLDSRWGTERVRRLIVARANTALNGTLSIESLRERLQDFVMRARAETGVPAIAIAASVGGRRVYAAAGTAGIDEREPFPIGAQFHPEKSSQPGVQFVKQFLDRARRVRDLIGPTAHGRA